METSIDNSLPDIPNITDEISLCFQLSSCKSTLEFKDKVHTILNKFGFSDFSLHTLGSRRVQGLSSIDQTNSKSEFYKGLAEFDLLLEHAQSSTQSIYLSVLNEYIAQAPFSSPRFTHNRTIYDHYLKMGYHDFYCVPKEVPDYATRVIFSITDKHTPRELFRKKIEFSKPVLSLVIDAIIFFGTSLFPEEVLGIEEDSSFPLAPKPFKLLTLMAKEGLLLKDAAMKLCISVDTANKHIASAKQSLGAKTLTQAVYLAMAQGLISDPNP